jgi:hypothetical protein
MNTMRNRTGRSSLPGRLPSTAALLLAMVVASVPFTARAEQAAEATPASTAGQVGHAVGSTMRDIGEGARDAGKAVGSGVVGAGQAVGHVARDAGVKVGQGAASVGRQIGHTARDGAKGLVNGIKGED